MTNPTLSQIRTSLIEREERSIFARIVWGDIDIRARIQVLIETVQKKTFEKIYKAQFLISSESGENFYDKIWEFPYEPSFPLEHSKSLFDPLTHFLDFYAYMILAGELDTYDLLQGTPLYDRALDIASQGVLSQYSRRRSHRGIVQSNFSTLLNRE